MTARTLSVSINRPAGLMLQTAQIRAGMAPAPPVSTSFGNLNCAPTLDHPIVADRPDTPRKFLHLICQTTSAPNVVVRLLKVEPKIYTGPKPVAKAERCVGGNAALAVHDRRHAAKGAPTPSPKATARCRLARRFPANHPRKYLFCLTADSCIRA
jgi:hypothetical protein